jgi:hypothetical protein
LLFVAVAMIATFALARTHEDPRPLLVDAHSPGRWAFEKTQAPPQLQPHYLLTPCPITPQNFPKRPPENDT